MKQSFYVYNDGEIKRKDITLLAHICKPSQST